MKTEIIEIEANNLNPKKINLAAKVLREGGLVAFPTETVYGLGANALDATAVRKIFKAKNRPVDNPLIVHIANRKDLNRLTTKIPERATLLMRKFWPGPLTIILKKSSLVQEVVTAGLDTVAIRMPSHPVARALIKSAEVPIAAPSANLAGKPSPTSAEHVIQDLKGKVEVIIDSGRTQVGLESTVLDLSSNTPTLLRPGGVTLEELGEILGKVKVHPVVKAEKKFKEIARSPGMKYKHYAPEAEVIVVEGKARENVRRKIREQVEGYRINGKRVGVMTTRKEDSYNANITKFLGETLEQIAKNLFKTLREMDKEGVDIIIVEGVETKGLGLAIMNRLKKAAGEIIKV